MTWQKIGKIYSPKGNMPWSKTHASVPIPYYLSKDLFRVYFSTRDNLNRNSLGYVEFDINNPREILKISSKPAFSFGKLGHFDCDGVYGTCIIKHNKNIRLYYAGWNAGIRGTFYSSIGLAISKDNGKTFQRYSESPILQRDNIDKWAVMAPFVSKIDKNMWHMWYSSGITLDYKNINKNQIKSKYDVKLAISKNGINWIKTGLTSFKLGKKDTNIARVCVLKNKDQFEAWYPYVNLSSKKYQIGYAKSKNGKNFTRLDKNIFSRLLISKKANQWDSKSVTYPYVFIHNNKYYMLYNGNEFGKTGFGLAIWKNH